ncbi:MAG: hypothetical protein KC466_16950, partial [Myxococcales bacterium]|nr:hypothetical protein [Myxococcales bacterium]
MFNVGRAWRRGLVLAALPLILGPAIAEADSAADVLAFNEVIGPNIEIPIAAVLDRATNALERLLATASGGGKSDWYELRIADGFKLAERARGAGQGLTDQVGVVGQAELRREGVGGAQGVAPPLLPALHEA